MGLARSTEFKEESDGDLIPFEIPSLSSSEEKKASGRPMGVSSLDTDSTIPPRGDLRHRPLGAVVGDYFYIGDKPFGVEPGFLAVEINMRLLRELDASGVLKLPPGSDADIDSLMPQRKKEFIQFLAREMQILHTQINVARLKPKKLDANHLGLEKMSKIEDVLVDPGKQDLLLVERLKNLELYLNQLKQTCQNPNTPESDQVPLWLIKQDYNAGRPYPPDDRLASTGQIQKSSSPFRRLGAYILWQKVTTSFSKQNKNALLECLANDVAGLFMPVQEQKLMRRDNDTPGEPGHFMTVCRWEPKLEMMTGCLAGSAEHNKYCIALKRDEMGDIIKGRDVQIASRIPEKTQPHQYYLVRSESEATWKLYYTNRKNVLSRIPDDKTSALKDFLLHFKQDNQSDWMKELDAALLGQKEANGKEYYAGPVPLRDSAGFCVADKTLDAGQFAPIMLLLADNDSIGSNGQNKGRVNGQFFGLDFGHAFRGKNNTNSLVSMMQSDFGFNNTSYKNIGSVFYDSTLSERCQGFFYLYKAMGEESRNRVFTDPVERERIEAAIALYKANPVFEKRLEKIVDGSLPAIFQQYQDKIEILIRDATTEKQKKAYRENLEQIQSAEKFAFSGFEGMANKMRSTLALSPENADLLHNLTKLTSRTSLASEDGTVLLSHMRIEVDPKYRTEWTMQQSDNNIITLQCSAGSNRQQELQFILFNYIRDNEVSDKIKIGVRQGQVFLTFDEANLKEVQNIFQEEKIKVLKQQVAQKLDVTPDAVKKHMSSYLATTGKALFSTKETYVGSLLKAINPDDTNQPIHLRRLAVLLEGASKLKNEGVKIAIRAVELDRPKYTDVRSVNKSIAEIMSALKKAAELKDSPDREAILNGILKNDVLRSSQWRNAQTKKPERVKQATLVVPYEMPAPRRLK